VRVDAALSRDLDTLMRTGITASDAIRAAVAMLADMHRTAWHHGICPENIAPRLLAYQLEQQGTPRTALTSGYDAVSDGSARTQSVSRRLPHPPVGRHLSA
jgi:hypothetical protein